MDLTLTAAEQAFRDEVRAFLKANLSPQELDVLQKALPILDALAPQGSNL